MSSVTATGQMLIITSLGTIATYVLYKLVKAIITEEMFPFFIKLVAICFIIAIIGVIIIAVGELLE